MELLHFLLVDWGLLHYQWLYLRQYLLIFKYEPVVFCFFDVVRNITSFNINKTQSKLIKVWPFSAKITKSLFATLIRLFLGLC